jgi:hypothetical protein
VSLVNQSSKQCADRRTKLTEEIKNVVTSATDSDVKQSDLIALLDLTDGDKNLLTRCVTASFPDCFKKTITTSKEKQ